VYTLLVSGEVEDKHHGIFTVGAGRFLEYTNEALSTQLESLSIEAVDCIKSWPCILMQEGDEDERANLAQVLGIERAGIDIRLNVAPVQVQPPIYNNTIWQLRHELDINDFEFHRHHFAVKERDLVSALVANGHNLGALIIDRFSNKPLPQPSRADLIAVIDVIEEWSHDKIDRFLLEAGVKELSAGRELGGRKTRAHAIVQFAITNPPAITAEGSLFSAFVIKRALPGHENRHLPVVPQSFHEAVTTSPSGSSKFKQGTDLNSDSAAPKPAKTGLKLFYSYSHKDEVLRTALETHLALLKRQGIISEWHDRRISAGTEWKDEIDSHLASADIVLLLVSADFIASDYCYDIEMRDALRQHRTGKSRVIPVILRAVDWTDAPFGKLQALPKDAKPITSWLNLDEAFKSVAIGLRQVANEVRREKGD
jgi:hypothetical protein